jgi:adenosylcobinamide-phosphate synthase
MIAAWKLASAYVLDWLVGDPECLPHPVRLIGAVTDGRHKQLLKQRSHPTSEYAKGAAFSTAIVATSAIAARGIAEAGVVCEVLLAATTLATRNLLDEAEGVLDALDAGELAMARTRLSRIVGRDTANLPEDEIVRAVIETLAESTCDGIVAPMLYLMLGSVPAAMSYKAVNTLDSMIGHREPPFTYFGRFVARLDDLANFLPARIAAASIALAAPLAGEHGPAWRVWREEGSHHASPNAGQVEAAMAGALDVRLGGTNYYDGNPVQGHVFNACGAVADRKRARAAIRVVVIASGLVFAATFSACLWNDLRKKEKQQDA